MDERLPENCAAVILNAQMTVSVILKSPDVQVSSSPFRSAATSHAASGLQRRAAPGCRDVRQGQRADRGQRRCRYAHRSSCSWHGRPAAEGVRRATGGLQESRRRHPLPQQLRRQSSKLARCAGQERHCRTGTSIRTPSPTPDSKAAPGGLAAAATTPGDVAKAYNFPTRARQGAGPDNRHYRTGGRLQGR